MQGIARLFDPLYALSSGNGLVAFAATTAADSVTASPVKTTSEAAAGPTIAQVTLQPRRLLFPWTPQQV